MRNIVVFILLMIASVAFAQNDRDYIRSGNRLYRNKSFDKAEVEYRKAVSANAENPQAVYNLGCSMMMQQKDSVAIQYFERASKLETNKLRRAKSNHNIGVILQNHKMYDKAIEAYVDYSLKNDKVRAMLTEKTTFSSPLKVNPHYSESKGAIRHINERYKTLNDLVRTRITNRQKQRTGFDNINMEPEEKSKEEPSFKN